jgi:hypothetical protein
MTQEEVKAAGWALVFWQPERYQPVSWTATGKVRSTEFRPGRFVVEKHAPDGRVVLVEAASPDELTVAIGAAEVASWVEVLPCFEPTPASCLPYLSAYL